MKAVLLYLSYSLGTCSSLIITQHTITLSSCRFAIDILFNLHAVPAGPPQNLFALANSANIIVVTWDSVLPIQQNGIITMYEILYEPLETFGGAIHSLTKTVSGTETLTVLTDLEEFVNYRISVRAYTSVGAGPYSGTTTDMTAEYCEYPTSSIAYHDDSTIFTSDPASPPSNINVMASSSTSITVTWDIVPPIDQNGMITMYEVLYQPQETFGGAIASASRTLPVTNMSVVLTNLEEFVGYAIFIRAFTSLGAGPFSNGMIQTTNTDGSYLHIY